MLQTDYRIAGIFLFFILDGVKSLEVNITGNWRSELGWEVVCRWQFPRDDRLQSVRIYNDNQQFLVYRPEKEGNTMGRFYRTPDNLMKVDCVVNEADREGLCTVLIEPYQPPTDKKLTCEVSGERPRFRVLSKDYDIKAFVAPSSPVLEASKQTSEHPGRVTLNCTSSGLPAPTFEWTVGYQKVPAEFTGRAWNATTKLWDVWSSLSTTYVQQTAVSCVPEVHTTDNMLARGNTATYDLEQSASSERLVSRKTLLFLLPLFQTLVRR